MSINNGDGIGCLFSQRTSLKLLLKITQKTWEANEIKHFDNLRPIFGFTVARVSSNSSD